MDRCPGVPAQLPGFAHGRTPGLAAGPVSACAVCWVVVQVLVSFYLTGHRLQTSEVCSPVLRGVSCFSLVCGYPVLPSPCNSLVSKEQESLGERGLEAPPVGTTAKALGMGPGLVGPSDPRGCLGAGEAASQ